MKIITQKELASLAEDAFKNAYKHGFYTESTEIETELMLIITEMAEAVQAERHNRHGSIEDYESEIQMGRDIPTAYKNSLEGTVESEFADIAIRILSLLGWMNSKSPIKINSNSVLSDEYEIGRIQYTIQNKIHRSNIAADLYRLNGKFSSFVDNESSYWFVSKTLQNILMRTFAERYAESAISECAFKTGAKWAICEFLNDLWHPASEKPLLRNGKCLVVYNSGKIDIFKISFVYEMLSNYGNDGMGWKCWCYISDLFPKEGGNHD